MTTGSLPLEGDPAGRERWRLVFSGYQTIVLVANSDAANMDSLRREHGDGALFVFFNKVYKVLDKPFDGNALLVARSSPAGANIVYRREVADVVRLVRSPHFVGICNLRAGSHERFSAPADFNVPEPVGHLDLAADLAGFYPSSHVATSGFALAIFLVELGLDTQIVLAGFTARRSVRWKLFSDHDWTFEQIVQRLLLRSGKLQTANPVTDDLFGAIARRFPTIDAASVATVAAEVLSERLEGANLAIDDILRLTRPQRRFDALIKRLKPKTRKARLAAKDATGEPAR